jgi:hypothetical protein
MEQVGGEGEGFERGKRGEELRVGGKGWDIITHKCMLGYLLKNVDN